MEETVAETQAKKPLGKRLKEIIREAFLVALAAAILAFLALTSESNTTKNDPTTQKRDSALDCDCPCET